MLIQFSLVGHNLPSGDPRQDFKMMLDSVPREDEVISLPGLSQADTYVRTVVWYPLGEDPSEVGEGEERDETPFVYVVVGPRKKS